MEKLELTQEQIERAVEFMEGDDLDFYEQILLGQPEEIQKKFFRENPDFLEEYGFSPLEDGGIFLLEDEEFRKKLRENKKR